MAEYRYSLDNRPRKRKHVCPRCGRPSLTLYIDTETGEIPQAFVDNNVGMCDHRVHCQYHYPPSQFFKEHPKASDRGWRDAPDWLRRGQGDSLDRCRSDFEGVDLQESGLGIESPTPSTIPLPVINRLMDRNLEDLNYCNLTAYLVSLYGVDNIKRVVREYRIGRLRDRRVVYPQIDESGQVRTAKTMLYDRNTGHRIKGSGHDAGWLHCNPILVKRGLIPDRNNYNLIQCLFGEHLLRGRPDAPVVLVEAEKTALVGSLEFPDCVWLATGGIGNLQPRKAIVLRGRKVIVFPDVGATDKWRERVCRISRLGVNITIRDFLERSATPQEREREIDIADRILAQRERKVWGREAEPPSVAFSCPSEADGPKERSVAPPDGKSPSEGPDGLAGSEIGPETLRVVDTYVSEGSRSDVLSLVRDLGLYVTSVGSSRSKQLESG